MNELSPLPDVGFDLSIIAGSVADSSLAMYQRDFRAYLEYAQTKKRALSPVTLAQWRVYLSQHTTMSPNTINRMMSAVKQFMVAAEEQEHISQQVLERFQRVRGIKKGAMKTRQRPHNRVRIEPQDMRRFIDSIDISSLLGKRNAALFLTLASSGLRVQELSRLKLQQVLRRKELYVLYMYAEEGKNQEEDREAFISKEAVEAIDAWVKARPLQSEYIFTSFQSKKRIPRSEPMTPAGIWQIIKGITELCGVYDIKPHDFRRFVGTQLAKKDIRLAQQALGHKSITTTAKYDLREIEPGATDHLF